MEASTACKLGFAVAAPGRADVDAAAAAAAVVVAGIAAGAVLGRVRRVAQRLHERLPAPVVRRVVTHPRRP